MYTFSLSLGFFLKTTLEALASCAIHIASAYDTYCAARICNSGGTENYRTELEAAHNALVAANGEPIDSSDIEPQSSPAYTGSALQNNREPLCGMRVGFGEEYLLAAERMLRIKKETRSLIGFIV